MAAKGNRSTASTGVRVLDLSQFEAGPSCTEALAWLGAEVVKVENPKAGDPGAQHLRRAGHDSFYFLIFNANKKSVTIDLKSAAGKKLVLDLAAKADVFVENFAPGAIERLGLGYDVVSKINPGIIYAQVKGFGEGSPFENNLAFDMIAQACGGIMSISGERDGRPSSPARRSATPARACCSPSRFSARSTRRREPARASACRSRCRTPCCTTSASPSPRRRATADRSSAPGDQTRLGRQSAVRHLPVQGRRAQRLRLRLHQPRQSRALEAAAAADRPRGPDRRSALRDAAARSEREAEVDALVSAWTKKHTKHEAMRLVGGAGIPAGAVLDTKELIEDPTFDQRGIMQTIEHPAARTTSMPAWPVRHNGKPPEVKPSPLLGEQHRRGAAELARHERERVEGLAQDKVISRWG